MNLNDLRSNAESHRDRAAMFGKRDEWALSVNSVAGDSVDAIAKRAKKPNPHVRVSTVGEIEALDCVSEVRPDPRPDGHANIVFAAKPTDADLLAVTGVFSDPVPNPGRQR